MEAGLDSLGALELKNGLSSHFNIDLPATLMFDYPTIAALAAFIASQMRVTDVATIRQESVAFERAEQHSMGSIVLSTACRSAISRIQCNDSKSVHHYLANELEYYDKGA